MKHFVIVAILVIISTLLVKAGLDAVGLLPVQASAQAGPIDRLFNVHFWLISFLFSLIIVFMLYSIVVFRRKPGETGEGAHFEGNTKLELFWTAVPLKQNSQAHHDAKHCHRRRRGRDSTARRLGGGDWQARPDRMAVVRHHLFLDAAAFLGAGPRAPQGLRARGRAHVPRHSRRVCHDQSNHDLYARASNRDADPPDFRRGRPPLSHRRAGAGRRVDL